MKEISEKDTVNEIVMAKPEAAELLGEVGLGCAGCGMSTEETLEQGAMGHGMSKGDIKELVKRINKKR